MDLLDYLFVDLIGTCFTLGLSLELNEMKEQKEVNWYTVCILLLTWPLDLGNTLGTYLQDRRYK